ncbi:MAG: hypothetical protein LBP52_09095 [Burkholderiaceae bacterium]|jgi:hypothetical protein|nr:hypothetical protein [Burkholderiaceae bacterium]
MKNQTRIEQQQRQARPALAAMATMAIVAALWCAQTARAQQVWRCTDGHAVVYSQTQCPGGAGDAIPLIQPPAAAAPSLLNPGGARDAITVHVQPNTMNRSAERAPVENSFLQKKIQEKKARTHIQARQPQTGAQKDEDSPDDVFQKTQAQQVWRCTDGNNDEVTYSQTGCPGGGAEEVAITLQPNTIDRSAERAHVTNVLLQKEQEARARMQAQWQQQKADADSWDDDVQQETSTSTHYGRAARGGPGRHHPRAMERHQRQERQQTTAEAAVPAPPPSHPAKQPGGSAQSSAPRMSVTAPPPAAADCGSGALCPNRWIR